MGHHGPINPDNYGPWGRQGILNNQAHEAARIQREMHERQRKTFVRNQMKDGSIDVEAEEVKDKAALPDFNWKENERDAYGK